MRARMALTSSGTATRTSSLAGLFLGTDAAPLVDDILKLPRLRHGSVLRDAACRYFRPALACRAAYRASRAAFISSGLEGLSLAAFRAAAASAAASSAALRNAFSALAAAFS